MTTRQPSAPQPTGRVKTTAAGHDLVLTRTLPVPLTEAWAAVTESERTAAWIGSWEGTGAAGETIALKMGFEEDGPATPVTITECAAPHRFRVVTVDTNGSWDLSLALAEQAGGTELTFVMHGVEPALVGEIGPGWEYYLDQLRATLTGADLPDFNDYFPAQREYFESQVR